jgi:sugar lactone lactonase YvrE
VNHSDYSRSALGLCAVAMFLAGCGASQPPISVPGAMPYASSQNREMQNREMLKSSSVVPTYKVSGPLLYVANIDQTFTPLAIYHANAGNPKPTATISKDIDNSIGACIDSDGTLYVTNSPNGGTGWVSEYALGQTKPLRMITKGIDSPGYCAIDGSGNLWVANIAGNDVTEYLKGSTKPYATITKGLSYPIGIAIDREGNLYVANYEPYSAQNIQVYAPGGKSPSRTITDGVAQPHAMAIDAHDTLYVTTFAPQGEIEEYRFGQSKPYRTITDKLSYPAGVVVSKDGWLYVANDGQYTNEMAILEFPPHSLKSSSREITKGLFHPIGVACYPPLLP